MECWWYRKVTRKWETSSEAKQSQTITKTSCRFSWIKHNLLNLIGLKSSKYYHNQSPRSILRKKIFWKKAANLQKNSHAKVQSSFIEITLRHGYSPVNMLHIFRTPFPKNTSEWLLLNIGIYSHLIPRRSRYLEFFIRSPESSRQRELTIVLLKAKLLQSGY